MGQGICAEVNKCKAIPEVPFTTTQLFKNVMDSVKERL
jgi:hypothetical protein